MMWLSLGLPGFSALILATSLLERCLAGPTHHKALPKHERISASERTPANPPLHIDTLNPLPLPKRAPNLQSTRVVEFLRETISIATASEQDIDNNHLWRITLEHISYFLFTPTITIDPISNAASKLTRLYDLAAATLYELIETHDHPQEDDDNVFALRLGQVAIEWSCRAEPLCWNLLYDFCLVMKRKTELGWTGMYSGELVNVGTGVVTWVRLTIRRGREGGNGIPVLPRRGVGGGSLV